MIQVFEQVVLLANEEEYTLGALFVGEEESCI